MGKIRLLVFGFSALAMLLAACGNIEDVPWRPCLDRQGTVGCGCDSTGGCRKLSDGTTPVCEKNVCAMPDCGKLGALTAGCVCGAAGACADGLVCMSGGCVADTGQTLEPPADAKCYTPCKSSIVRDGVVVACSDEGLLEGCVDAGICRNGSCVVPSATAPPGTGGLSTQHGVEAAGTACTQETDCPEFQTCIQGACYSDCEMDGDCRAGRSCHGKVCRVGCTVGDTSACEAGTACKSDDGTTGFCMPVANHTDDATPVVSGRFSVAPDSLKLRFDKVSDSFTIQNDAPDFRNFRVRKLSHTEYLAEGSRTISENPLHWLGLGKDEASAEKVEELVIGVDGNGGTAQVFVTGAANPTLNRWDGKLEISTEGAAAQDLLLSYTGSLEGHWAGNVFFLANFGERGIDAWQKDPTDPVALRAVGNALIRRWGAFRASRITLDEFQAALTATQTGSWKWPSVVQRCPDAANPNPNVGCYLYSNAAGLSVYSDFLPENPVPTGITEFPLGLNLHHVEGDAAGQWSGRIVSDEALQYAGNPAVSLAFDKDPNDCSGAAGATCIIGVSSFSARVLVGGRYITTAEDTSCSRASGFKQQSVPWLVPSFGPAFDAATNRSLPPSGNYRYECRDTSLPFGGDSKVAALNLSLAGANPIPDGATRRRTLELLDGALIDQKTLFVLFRERFPSFLDPQSDESFSAYGYMLLERSPANVDQEQYKGSNPIDPRPAPAGLLAVGCSADVLAHTGVTRLDDATAVQVGAAVLEGVIPSNNAPPVIGPADAEKVHYYCGDSGQFDGGPGDDGSTSATRSACPEGSFVRYFTLTGTGSSQAEIAALSCEANAICNKGETCERVSGCTPGQACAAKGSCGALLEQWAADPDASHVRMDPAWRCSDGSSVFCSDDRNDLRAGKTFYGSAPAQVVYRNLDDLVTEAFRYKTQFVNRSGTSLGFVPQVCIPRSDKIPYCYDPEQIEEIRDRVDCAVSVYAEHYDALGQTDEGKALRGKLKNFLVRSFAYDQTFAPGVPTPIIHDGFERLYAELLVMLGDESYTSSFKSRFDLAGQSLADFEGSKFEPGGINLSGGAGFELFSLYQAVQYYQMSLDRFFRYGPVMWTSLAELPDGQGFVTPATATSYFGRLIRASSQKARAWSEVSKRYQAFNRPDLARLVVGRAYTSAYLESVMISRLMQRLISRASDADRAQIVKQLEQAQAIYRAALADMSNVYKDITDQITYFGFQPDYIPFPALDPGDTNAFAKSIARAKDKLDVAADKEQTALDDTRNFDTDAATFQAELAQLRDSYEGQLGDICGTFVATVDGESTVVPAIPKYAYLDPRTASLGDPCGLVGNGGIYDAAGALEQGKLDVRSVQLQYKNLLADIDAEQVYYDGLCGETTGVYTKLKDAKLTIANKDIELNKAILGLQSTIEATDRLVDIAATVSGLTKCSVGTSTDCPTAALGLGAYLAISLTNVALTTSLSAGIDDMQIQIQQNDATEITAEFTAECDAAKLDKDRTVQGIYRRVLELNLEALKLDYSVQLGLSAVQKLRNQAQGLMASQEDAESQLIDVEAARNDPNIRIYKNDAVLTADRTFYSALAEAYKATKVFEYYTSQSYAPLGNLVLVRMVSHGDFTLEAYLADLEDAFFSWQEQFGNPDTRVIVLSVRDDVLNVPRLAEDGTALSADERVGRFRKRIQETTLLDDRGYIAMPFATNAAALSPLTRNHKILYMQAEMVGAGVGDALGRLYVSQRGTSSVRSLEGATSFFAFPERVAVMNPLMNGEMPLDPAVYRSERLRDRPLLNTGWNLVLNKKDEQVNEDLDLEGLDDIRLYVYYTDFTAL